MSPATVWIVWKPRTETLGDERHDDFGEALVSASFTFWQVYAVCLHEATARIDAANHRGWRVEQVEVQQ